MEEIWRDIVDYEGLYQVSNLGRVRSLDRYVKTTPNGIETTRLHKGKILTPKINRYAQVALSKNGVPSYHYIHRLVAIAFIPNPDNKPEVNHINGLEKLNNCVDNLEWATRKENEQHKHANGLYVSTEKHKKQCAINQKKSIRKIPVVQLTLDGEFVAEFESGKDVYIKLGIKNVNSAIKGSEGRTQAGGYRWMYKSDYYKDNK